MSYINEAAAVSGDVAGAAVDHLDPDEGEHPDRGRPAAEALRVDEVRGVLPGEAGEGAADGAADRAPGVEGPEDVAKEHAQHREAQPGGDEEERQGEIAVGRFGAAQAGVDRDPEQEDAERAADDLGGKAEQGAGEPLAERPPVFVLEFGLAPGRGEGEEGDDEDDRGRPREQPGRDRCGPTDMSDLTVTVAVVAWNESDARRRMMRPVLAGPDARSGRA